MKRILLVMLIALLMVPLGGTKGANAILGFWEEEKPDETKLFIKTIQPHDKLVTFADEIKVGAGDELQNVKLKNLGKNSIVLELQEEEGKRKRILRRVLRLPSFKDVPDGFWAKTDIELAVASNLFTKPRSVYFRPDATLSKENFARIMTKALGVAPVAVKEDVARDVGAKSMNAKYINYMVNIRKIMDLDKAGNFNPTEKITRGEAIIAFCRLERIEENWSMDEAPFPDLQPRHPLARYISGAQKAGLLDFAVKRGYLDVDGLLTNAELASLLTKTKFGKSVVTDMLNWDTGYGVNIDSRDIIALTR